MDKSADAFRTISEAADELDVPQHVLRFWETRFAQIKPMKRGGGRRYYRPDDMELLRAIRHLLYGEGYTIRGVQRLLKERGVKAIIALRTSGGPLPADMAALASGPPARRRAMVRARKGLAGLICRLTRSAACAPHWRTSARRNASCARPGPAETRPCPWACAPFCAECPRRSWLFERVTRAL